MATVKLTFNIPDELASQLEEYGLLQDDQFVTQALQNQLEHCRTWKQLEQVFQEADADPEQMTMEDVVAEVKVYRAEQAALRKRDEDRS
jgi:hypothetical protein